MHALVGRIGRCAEVRIDADTRERELAHVRAAQVRAAGRAQAGDSHGVLRGGRRRAQDDRARRGDVTFDIEQVLDRDGQAGKRQVCTGSGRSACFVEAGLDENLVAGRRACQGDGFLDFGRDRGAALGDGKTGAVEVGKHGGEEVPCVILVGFCCWPRLFCRERKQDKSQTSPLKVLRPLQFRAGF